MKNGKPKDTKDWQFGVRLPEKYRGKMESRMKRDGDETYSQSARRILCRELDKEK